MTVGDDHRADAVASPPGAGALPVASSPSNKSFILVNGGFEDTPDARRGAADRGEYRQVAGAIAQAVMQKWPVPLSARIFRRPMVYRAEICRTYRSRSSLSIR